MFNVKRSVYCVHQIDFVFMLHFPQPEFLVLSFAGPMSENCLNIIKVVVSCIHNRRMLHATFLKYNLLANRANRSSFSISPSLQQTASNAENAMAF